MNKPVVKPGAHLVVERRDVQKLLDVIRDSGYDIVAPTATDDAIILGEISRVEQLPVGLTDVQGAGRYRLEARDDQALFGYVVGPQSWKKILHPPRQKLWEAERRDSAFSITDHKQSAPRVAFLGVRPCELAAIAIQDKVFTEGEYLDTAYLRRRTNTLLVVVNCSQAGGTCFCASMQTGPKAKGGFDLALTELIDDDRHYFVLEVGSQNGAGIADRIPCRAAEKSELARADRVLQTAAANMGRSLDTRGIRELLLQNVEHPQRDRVAERCLSCANCTMVCPTCFCTTIEDTTDLAGNHSERWKTWDSCFSLDFSYIHGGSVRQSIKSRYRQWLSHKLSSWIDQFDTSGCVGCGRCITWCPAGIDITEEARVIRENSLADATAVAEEDKKDAIT